MNKTIILVFCTLLFFVFLWACGSNIGGIDKGAQFIAIQPLNQVNENDLNITKKAIEDFYGYDVTILEPITLPSTTRTSTLESYKASELLTFLHKNHPKGFSKIIGIINDEISSALPPKGELLIILAKSDRHGPASVISTKRIKESTHNRREFRSALRKITLHEIGHTLGLQHCSTESKCLLKDFQGSIDKLEKQEEKLCDNCSLKLGWGQVQK